MKSDRPLRNDFLKMAETVLRYLLTHKGPDGGIADLIPVLLGSADEAAFVLRSYSGELITAALTNPSAPPTPGPNFALHIILYCHRKRMIDLARLPESKVAMEMGVQPTELHLFLTTLQLFLEQAEMAVIIQSFNISLVTELG